MKCLLAILFVDFIFLIILFKLIFYLKNSFKTILNKFTSNLEKKSKYIKQVLDVNLGIQRLYFLLSFIFIIVTTFYLATIAFKEYGNNCNICSFEYINPEGLTSSELANIIRTYYPDQYEYMDDEALVSTFKGRLDLDTIHSKPKKIEYVYNISYELLWYLIFLTLCFPILHSLFLISSILSLSILLFTYKWLVYKPFKWVYKGYKEGT